MRWPKSVSVGMLGSSHRHGAPRAIVSPRPDYQLPDPSPSTFVWGGDDDGDSFAERMESTPLMGLSAAYGWCLQDNELARAPARP